MISNPKHQIWIFPLLGAALGGVSQVLGGQGEITVTAVVSGAIVGLLRYLQYVFPDTGTSGLLMKPTKTQTEETVSKPKPYIGEG